MVEVIVAGGGAPPPLQVLSSSVEVPAAGEGPGSESGDVGSMGLGCWGGRPELGAAEAGRGGRGWCMYDGWRGRERRRGRERVAGRRAQEECPCGTLPCGLHMSD